MKCIAISLSTFLIGSALTAEASPLLKSSWPKFRADFAQTGRSSLPMRMSDQKPWVFKTSKGIFSSPVIGPRGEIYIGSADRNFYALSSEGQMLWKVPTGEIIDSSALLDSQGRLTFGSGDGILRSLERESGNKI